MTDTLFTIITLINLIVIPPLIIIQLVTMVTDLFNN